MVTFALDDFASEHMGCECHQASHAHTCAGKDDECVEAIDPVLARMRVFRNDTGSVQCRSNQGTGDSRYATDEHPGQKLQRIVRPRHPRQIPRDGREETSKTPTLRSQYVSVDRSWIAPGEGCDLLQLQIQWQRRARSVGSPQSPAEVRRRVHTGPMKPPCRA